MVPNSTCLKRPTPFFSAVHLWTDALRRELMGRTAEVGSKASQKLVHHQRRVPRSQINVTRTFFLSLCQHIRKKTPMHARACVCVCAWLCIENTECCRASSPLIPYQIYSLYSYFFHGNRSPEGAAANLIMMKPNDERYVYWNTEVENPRLSRSFDH